MNEYKIDKPKTAEVLILSPGRKAAGGAGSLLYRDIRASGVAYAVQQWISKVSAKGNSKEEQGCRSAYAL
jgi:hypothetical protein